jgi:hypothetical protein
MALVHLPFYLAATFEPPYNGPWYPCISLTYRWLLPCYRGNRHGSVEE